MLSIYFDLCTIHKIALKKPPELVNYIGSVCVQDCEYAGIHTKETVFRVHGETLNGPRLVLLPLPTMWLQKIEILAFKR